MKLWFSIINVSLRAVHSTYFTWTIGNDSKLQITLADLQLIHGSSVFSAFLLLGLHTDWSVLLLLYYNTTVFWQIAFTYLFCMQHCSNCSPGGAAWWLMMTDTNTSNINPLKSRGNYIATSNNMKLVHTWPLMGGPCVYQLHIIRCGNIIASAL